MLRSAMTHPVLHVITGPIFHADKSARRRLLFLFAAARIAKTTLQASLHTSCLRFQQELVKEQGPCMMANLKEQLSCWAHLQTVSQRCLAMR
mmetsp:Transcript_150725/g.482277  ORF Transcript_150725/g.482277 Transcript_150725/m.482277 type:complete len:92 (+) Transcript_150725:73-348(+)